MGVSKEGRGLVLNLLNKALAREIVGILRYKRHESTAKTNHAGLLAAEFRKLSHEGQAHIDLLADAISQLGGNPNFTPIGLIMNGHADYVEGRSLPEMINDDWVAERTAIDSFGEIILLTNGENPALHQMLEKIMFSKKKQTETIANLLLTFKSSTNGGFSHQSESMVKVGGRLCS